MGRERIPENLPFENAVEQTADYEKTIQENAEIVLSPEQERQREEEALFSLDITPPQRKKIRELLESLRSERILFADFARGLRNKDQSEIPSNVLKSELVQDAIKKRVQDEVKKEEPFIGRITELMKTFGISEDFFKSPEFDIYRCKRWLRRIENGEQINDPERSDRDWYGNRREVSPEEKLKNNKEEELSYGVFEKIIPDPNVPEIREAALKGMVSKTTNFFNKEEKPTQTLEEYEEVFSISEDEFEQGIIEKLRQETSRNVDDYIKLSKYYPQVDTFLHSEEGKEWAKGHVISNVIHGGSIKNSDFAKYLSITEEDLDPRELRLRQKEDLFEELSRNESSFGYINHDIERAAKRLSPADWEEIFANEEYLRRLTDGFARSFHSVHMLDEIFDLASRINLPKEALKEAAIKGIATNITSDSHLSLESLAKFQERAALSEEETRQGLALGFINMISKGESFYRNRKNQIREMREEFNLSEMGDSPLIQKTLKDVYLKKLAEGDTADLKDIEENFTIGWEDIDRPKRRQAIKEALMNRYILLRFPEIRDIEEFIDTYYPETHKKYWLLDEDLSESVKKTLATLPLYDMSVKNGSPDFLIEIARYFNIPAEEITSLVKNRIESGYFIANDWQKRNCKIFVPEMNLKEENEICLKNHGPELINKALETKDWKVLKEIQQYPESEAKQRLDTILAEQERILTDESKSIAARHYALEALSHLAQGAEYLEKRYFEDVVRIYTATDRTMLLNLLKRQATQLANLDEKVRSAAFDAILGDEKSSLNNEQRISIDKTNAVAFFSKEQIIRALDSNAYNVAMIGLGEALRSKESIPEHIYEALYNRIKEDDPQNISDSYRGDFAKSLIELLNLKPVSPKQSQEDYIYEEVIKNKGILKELAAHPKSIEIIRKIVEQVPIASLIQNWDYLYAELKDLNESEFAQKIELVQRLHKQASNPVVGLHNQGAFQSFFKKISSYTEEDQERFFKILELQGKQEVTFNKEQWAAGIISYVDAAEEGNQLGLSPESKAAVLNFFDGPYKDTALTAMHDEWRDFLSNRKGKTLPANLFLTSKVIDKLNGAGNLKHVESLGNLIWHVDKVFDHPKTVERTKTEVKDLLVRQEERAERERWSLDDRSEFYNLSRDILQAAPSLYVSFGPLFEELSPKELKQFLNEIFPLYHAQLVTIQDKMDYEDVPGYKSRDLVNIRQTINGFVEELKERPQEKTMIFEKQRDHTLAIIRSNFKERFGILKMPETFTREHIRSLQNCVRYLGNINHREGASEATIAYFLSLELNDEWENFRQGKMLAADQYLSEQYAALLRGKLERRQESFILPLEIANIPPEKAGTFQALLQDDVISNMMGNIQTIDVKLGNIKRNLEELADPDIYTNSEDKDLMRLLAEEGKAVGSALAKIHGEVSGKKVDVSDKEREIQKELSGILKVDNWSVEKVKNTQDRLQPFGLITNMMNKINEERVDHNIEELQLRLIPSEKIIEIFNRLGEDFKLESGAFALAKDLSYLESLVIKDDRKLSAEEKIEVNGYLDSIKDKMKDLESSLDKIKEYFTKIRKSVHISGHEILKNRLDDIEKTIYSKDSNAMITSRLTKDLNLIIENMRQCLGCLRKEANNDTNLAFGDYNKFFLINQSEKEKGSISDEIVFFAPLGKEGEDREMSFVMDRVYGSKSSDILISNILSVYKKYQAIKKEIPEARLSISVSRAALSSVGLSEQSIQGRLKEILPSLKSAEYKSDLTVTIPKSSLSDNYIEFGGIDPRAVGEREISAVILR